MTHTTSRNSKTGFTLIELVIVLGITGLIFSGLWGLLTSGSTALQAQSAAQQYRQVIEATRKYATSGVYDGQPAGIIASPPTIATYTGAGVNLLPSTFPTTDAYGNAITIAVEVIDSAKQQFRFLVHSGTKAALPTVILSDKVGAQVASLIGSEGGFVYGSATDGCAASGVATSTACGSFNSFSLNITAAPFSITGGKGRIVAMGYTIDTNAGTAPWLYRKAGVTAEQNTMQQNMLFNSGLSLAMQGSSIFMNASAASASGGGKLIMSGGNLSLGADAATTGGGTLYMGGGSINNLLNVTGGNSSLSFNDVRVTTSSGNVTLDAKLGTIIKSTGGAAISLDITGVGKADEFQAGKFIYSSDASMKENFVPIADALSKVLQLRGFNYQWKGTHGHDLGLVAQDVQKVFPELVTKLPEGKMGVDYPKMIAPIVEAIRQLKEENDTLRQKVDMLQKQIKPSN